jgi:hypothetical protein
MLYYGLITPPPIPYGIVWGQTVKAPITQTFPLKKEVGAVKYTAVKTTAIMQKLLQTSTYINSILPLVYIYIYIFKKQIYT